MSVTKVSATLEDQTTELKKSKGSYIAEMYSPDSSGDYDLFVSAYDEAGNEAVVTKTLEVTLWKDPKTNWNSTDKFNFSDYNRIKNNLLYLYELSLLMFEEYDIEDLGEDMTSYLGYFRAFQFNAIEKTLEILNEQTYNEDIGTKQTFYDNGAFIKWDELNRIEDAQSKLYFLLHNQKKGLRRLSFRCGRFKEVKV